MDEDREQTVFPCVKSPVLHTANESRVQNAPVLHTADESRVQNAVFCIRPRGK